MAAERDLALDAGTTIRWSLIWRRPVPAGAPAGTQGEPYDLNSATARMHLRSSRNRTGRTLLELDEKGGLYLGGQTGLIVIEMTAAQTQTFTVRRAFYDVFVTLANGETHKIMKGKIKIDPNVTHPSTTWTPGVGVAIGA